MKSSSIRVAIDIGGTFTDLVLIDEGRGRAWIEKVLTTPHDPAEGTLAGFRKILEAAHMEAGDVSAAVHATTLVTNALIERKGAPTGLITTRGFSDVIEIQREKRYDLYDLFQKMPEPLVPRELRAEVPERVSSEGNIVEAVSLEAVREAARSLFERGAKTLALVFLNAPVNSANEARAFAEIEKSYSDLPVSLSSEVAPETGEYERTSTTAANAYVRPIVDRYLDRLVRGFRAQGFLGSLLLMLSNGGFSGAEDVRRFPIRILESGPAGGALAAAQVARLGEEPHVLGFDMGGTTAKICLVEEGEPSTVTAFEAARTSRFQRGSGLPILSPAVDLVEIGAGGGSIAQVSPMGLLQVGPASAGAVPGPVCYGSGGSEPTVTDANLLLGYLNPEYFLGGEMRLETGAAREALASLGERLGLGCEETAWGVHEIVTEQMASAARIHIAEKGADPRNYTLVATGGAAPLHACHMARKLFIRKVVCPPAVGVASAAGLLLARPRADAVRAYVAKLDSIDWERVDGLFGEMAVQAQGALRFEDSGAKWEYLLAADMRYQGQLHTVAVSLPAMNLRVKRDSEEVRKRFEDAYLARFFRKIENVHIEVAAWRLTMLGPKPEAAALDEASGRAGASHRKGERPVYDSAKKSFAPADVYDRYALPVDERFEGPALIEERESTIFAPAGASFSKDGSGNVEINWGPA